MSALAPSMGNVTIDNVSVSGLFHKIGVAFYNYADIDGLTIGGTGDLDLSSVETIWGAALNIDGIAADFDASVFDLSLPAGAGIHTELQGDKLGQAATSQTIIGTTSNDRLVGKGGNDTLHGGQGDDMLFGADVPGQPLDGDTGADTLFGEAGIDQLFGGAGSDTLDGGAGSRHDGGRPRQRHLYRRQRRRRGRRKALARAPTRCSRRSATRWAPMSRT